MRVSTRKRKLFESFIMTGVTKEKKGDIADSLAIGGNEPELQRRGMQRRTPVSPALQNRAQLSRRLLIKIAHALNVQRKKRILIQKHKAEEMFRIK